MSFTSAPILQFGTGRFLQAHIDLFVSEALAHGRALGGITVVQSTSSVQSSVRAAALVGGYRVELRGMVRGERVESAVQVAAVRAVLHADRDWAVLLAAVASHVRVIVSNTADSGYQLEKADGAALLAGESRTPRSYPAKLLVLLHRRWQISPSAPLTLFPCELVSRNGDTLRDIVAGLGGQWGAPPAFLEYVTTHCVWVSSLVDRIVSSPLSPAGAVAEPYALWAVERTPRMELPCIHPAIVVTDDLAGFVFPTPASWAHRPPLYIPPHPHSLAPTPPPPAPPPLHPPTQMPPPAFRTCASQGTSGASSGCSTWRTPSWSSAGWPSAAGTLGPMRASP